MAAGAFRSNREGAPAPGASGAPVSHTVAGSPARSATPGLPGHRALGIGCRQSRVRTTIGILQHPDIKSGGHASPDFDVLIVDEASKTPFQEFLVPALLAKRWIIVGDPKQLLPVCR